MSLRRSRDAIELVLLDSNFMLTLCDLVKGNIIYSDYYGITCPLFSIEAKSRTRSGCCKYWIIGTYTLEYTYFGPGSDNETKRKPCRSI